MLTLIEDDGDSLAKNAKMYYRRKPKLKQMVEEFNRAYHYLAEKYDQLWSESTHVQTSEFSSSSSNSTEVHHGNKNVVSFDYSKWEAFHLHPESVVECDNLNLDFEPLDSDKKSGNTDKMNGTATDLSDKGDIPRKKDGYELSKIAVGEFPACGPEQENTWLELRFQVMKLIEENLQQQAELIRRNDENRETIKELRFELERLKSENRALQSCLRCSKVDVKHNRSRLSKLKGLVLSKFFRESSS